MFAAAALTSADLPLPAAADDSAVSAVRIVGEAAQVQGRVRTARDAAAPGREHDPGAGEIDADVPTERVERLAEVHWVSSATSGTGISQVQAFLGNRDLGGTPIGVAAFPAAPTGLPGAWQW